MRRLKAFTFWVIFFVWALGPLAAQTVPQVPIWTYYDCLYEGSRENREADRQKLEKAGFNGIATQITSDALTAGSIDARFLDACRASKLAVIVLRNRLELSQYQQVVQKWPDVVKAVDLCDDADKAKTPAELTKMAAEAQPFLAGSGLFFSVSKAAPHKDYAPIAGRGWYGIQNYLGKAVDNGEGLKQYAYDGVLAARPFVAGRLLTMPYLGKNATPNAFRNDPTWQAQEYVWPATNEAVAWLGLIAGADGVLYYSAFAIDPNNAIRYYRAGERRDLLAAYGRVHAKIQEHASFLTDPAVIKGRQVVGSNVVGTWQKPGGDLLTVTVDLGSEWHPRTSWLVTPPPPPPVAGSFRFTVDGAKLKVVELP